MVVSLSFYWSCSEKPSVFVPKNRDDQWIWVDVPALNRYINREPLCCFSRCIDFVLDSCYDLASATSGS